MALGFLATKARSDVLTLSLPADLASGLVVALDQLRSTAAPERRAPLDDLARALPGGEATEVTARRDLLSEVVTVAIDEAGNKVSECSTRLLRGEGSADELRARLAELDELLDLLELVDPGS
ncbi:MAG: hypothetical protein H0T69_08770 [Thermoleophilaceae bacterium]|nr:hypothetical protein [Thermoleophilaceae bacterium]